MKVSRSTSGTLVREQLTRRDVQKDLKKLGFRASVLGANVRTLRKLNLDQYQKFLDFLKNIRTYIGQHFIVGENEFLSLTLPAGEALARIDFGKLLKDEKKMAYVYEICVMPKGRPEVDLRELFGIYRMKI